MPNAKDITGQRFGKLVVLKRIKNDKDGNAMWECRCDCGNLHVVMGSRLRKGQCRSCGCLQKEIVSKNSFIHGMSGGGKWERTSLYRSWNAMKQRCVNPNNAEYSHYGGRGISYCKEWEDFSNFMKWALNNGWKSGLTIDRIDNDKGYSPDNCRWVTRAEQNRNQSRTHIIMDGDKRLTASQVGKMIGVSSHTMAKWCREENIKTLSDALERKSRMRSGNHGK